MSKRRQRSTGVIDKNEKLSMIGISFIYALVFGFLSGYIKVSLAEINYIFGFPFDAGTFVWLFGLALWGILVIFLNVHYKYR